MMRKSKYMGESERTHQTFTSTLKTNSPERMGINWIPPNFEIGSVILEHLDLLYMKL